MTTDLQQDHRRWLEELVLELRLRDANGRQIGDAVASAREFLADAGVPAQEAFGPAGEYAETLALQPAPGTVEELHRTVAFAAVGVLGFLAFAFTGGDAWRGERFDLDLGSVVLAAGALALVLLTPWMLPTVLRAAPWKVALGASGLFLAQMAAVFALGDVVLAAVPAWPVAALGLAVLVGAVLRAWFARDELADPVVEPLGTEAPDRGWVARHDRVLVVLPQVVSLVAAWGFVLLDVATGG
ncbi:hypothetical protein [Nocardioides campestrisoli]|uniref:hypothetical protein n=1 Tax=Nocardioides campestrisoli TaxID=2736757 RepID=UPI0015E6DF3C|nr:hypothetical protein [Nocardioides campestrisoli]